MSRTTHKSTHRNEIQAFPVTTWRVLLEKASFSLGGEEIKPHLMSIRKQKWKRSNCAEQHFILSIRVQARTCFTLHLNGGFPALGGKPFKSAQFCEERTLLWGTRVHTICEETREEEILKALNQTGKTSTHNWAEKSPQIFPSLPKWQFVCKLRPPKPPPPPPHPAVNAPSPLHPYPHERWGKEWASVLSFLFHFTGEWFIPEVLFYRPCVTRSCPVSPSSHRQNRSNRSVSTLHMESKRQIHIQLFGWDESGFSSSVWGS